MEKLTLRELKSTDESSFREAIESFRLSDPTFCFAFDFDDSTEFSSFLRRIKNHEKGVGLPKGWVPNSFLVGVLGDEIVGRVSVRHSLTEALYNHGGHIGFGVVSKHRRKGVGKEMLRQGLLVAKAIKLERVLVTCDDDNMGSIKTIEALNGTLEDCRLRNGGEKTRRYWIQIN